MASSSSTNGHTLLVARPGASPPPLRQAALLLLLLLAEALHERADAEPSHPTFHSATALPLGASSCPKFEYYTRLHRAALNGQGVPPDYLELAQQHRHMTGGRPRRKLRGAAQPQPRGWQEQSAAVPPRGQRQSRRQLGGGLLATTAAANTLI